MTRGLSILTLCLTLLAGSALAEPPGNARTLLDRLLDADAFGFGGAQIVARITLSDKRGSKRQLSFISKSKRHDPPYAKSIVRFSEPSDLAGAAFLQVQQREGDDDRYLYLPELKRSRRIAGGLRSSAFMGTDFSYADLDQRDFRNSTVSIKGEEQVAKWSCDVLDVVPKSGDSEYSHVEIWLRKDNALPMKMKMYDRSKTLLKSFEALEFKRVSGRWFISRSRITNNQADHSTELALEQITVTNDVSDEEFTVRALEKS